MMNEETRQLWLKAITAQLKFYWKQPWRDPKCLPYLGHPGICRTAAMLRNRAPEPKKGQCECCLWHIMTGYKCGGRLSRHTDVRILRLKQWRKKLYRMKEKGSKGRDCV